MKHVVKFRESERGWCGEVCYNVYDDKLLAIGAIKNCNENLPKNCPDYYIVAEYLGEMEEKDIPKGFKF